jgi:CelD/BcsL family acetyltransferase involved in cellulose biosynthesis
VYTTSPPDNALTNGIPFCQVSSWLTGRRMVSVPFADHCDPLVEREEDWSALLGAIAGATSRQRQYVELRPRRACTERLAGFRTAATYFLHTIDLTPDLDTLFDNMHKSTVRRKIRRAEREGLTCEEGRSDALQRAFYDLFVMTRRRHRVPPQPFEWFANLMTCLDKDATLRVAFRGSRAVGAMMTLRHNDTLVYKYGASDAAFHNLGTMPFLFWKAIQDAKTRDLRMFDLGRSDTNDAGLCQFKQRLGATAETLGYVRYPYSRDRGAFLGRVSQNVVARMPDSIFVLAGRLIYRHLA